MLLEYAILSELTGGDVSIFRVKRHLGNFRVRCFTVTLDHLFHASIGEYTLHAFRDDAAMQAGLV